MSELRAIFSEALVGPNFRVIQFEHRWLKVYAHNWDGRAALLVRERIPDDLFVEDGRGFTVMTSRAPSDSFVRLVSAEVGANPIFLRLVEFVLERTQLATNHNAAVASLAGAVVEFKNFSARRHGRLTQEEIQGLFAELLMLEHLLDKNFDAAEAVMAWKGPFASDGIGLHDFVLADGSAIEVKSCRHPGTAIRVSSPDQLRPRDFQLRLAVLPVEAVPSSSAQGIDLIHLVQRCTDRLALGPVATSDQFVDALEQISLDFSDEYYKRIKFVPSGWKCFEVRDGFPTMPVDTFARAIIRVKYSLDLDQLGDFNLGLDQLLPIRG